MSNEKPVKLDVGFNEALGILGKQKIKVPTNKENKNNSLTIRQSKFVPTDKGVDNGKI